MAHDDLKVERELRYAHLERRRMAHTDPEKAGPLNHAHRQATKVHFERVWRPLPRAVATAALLLGLLTGIALI